MVTKLINASETSLSQAEHVRNRFVTYYPAYQYQMVEFIAEHLADLSRIFRGDLQEMMVLAIIGQLAIRARKAALADPKSANTKGIQTSITASRLADVTGIPRQTVRRKLESLEKRGWIERAGGSSYQLVIKEADSPARQDLSAVDQRSIERAARLFCGLKRIVDEPNG